MATWNEKLAEWRSVKGISQAAFARMVGVSPPTVFEWESGKTKNLKHETLVRVCKATLTTPERLLNPSLSHEKTFNGASEEMDALPQLAESDGIYLEGSVDIPRMDARASAGTGAYLPEHDSIIDYLRISLVWCRKNLTVSALNNLAALSAYGDSMRPTFDDGDILLVDRGIEAVKIDAVYVLQFRDELYVKRVQRRPEGTLILRSDNDLYEPITIDPASDGLRVLGRVVWAWNGRKL